MCRSSMVFLFFAFPILASLSGCGPSESSVQQVAEDAASLKLTAASKYQPLLDELQRLGGDHALPGQLDESNQDATLSSSFAGSLDELIEEIPTQRILERMDEFFPPEEKRPSALTLEKASGFLQFYRERQLATRKCLNGPQDRFQWKTSDGWFIDTSFTDKSAALCSLELIAGLDAVSQGRMSQAIESLSYSSRIIRLLASDPHPVSRLTAVGLRRHWLFLVSIAVAHPDLQRKNMDDIYQMLLNQIGQWPEESKPWIVDRAIGMQTYELIRQGHYLSLLTPEEAEALESDGMHIIKSRSVQRYIDQDEMYYLDTMRRIIDSTSMVYYQRQPVWESISKSMLQATESEHYPQIAIEMLLPDLQSAQQQIADDRARVEAWTMAVGHSVGNQPPRYPINPGTGAEFKVASDDQLVEVTGLSPEQFAARIVVPRFPPESKPDLLAPPSRRADTE